MSVLEIVVTILGIIVSCTTIFSFFFKPILKLNTTLTELIDNIKDIKEDFNTYRSKNAESHEKLWRHEGAQDKVINKHSIEIALIQKHVGLEVDSYDQVIQDED